MKYSYSRRDLKKAIKAIEKLCNESKLVYPNQIPKAYIVENGVFKEIKGFNL